tara:strand:+ start:231 stop:485 length:255 start_codon:yes stop_codon:yes gene_type:complete
MSEKDLRAKIIRLAHQKPELRKHLLPLVTRTAMSTKDRKRLDVLQKKEDLDSLSKPENTEYEALVKEYRKTPEYKKKQKKASSK